MSGRQYININIIPEPLWYYSWFHPLLKILLHNWAPSLSKETLDPPLYLVNDLANSRTLYIDKYDFDLNGKHNNIVWENELYK